MKSSPNFLMDILACLEPAKQLCKEELKAMSEDFCKHKEVELKYESQNCEYPYFEYTLGSNLFINRGFNSMYKVCSVRYYADENEWTVMTTYTNDLDYIDELCVEDLNIQTKIELIMLLKNELFNLK